MDDREIDRILDMALIHHQAGRLSHAEERYRRVLAARPDNAEATHFLGLAAYQGGRPDEAIDLMRESLALVPDQPTYHNNLGIVYRSLQRFGEASACFRRAVALDPDFIEALNNLGLSLRDEGRRGEAIETLRRAIDLAPATWELHNTLGTVLAAQNDYAQAAACYGRALDLAPGEPEALNNLATAQRATGQVRQAIASFEAALAAAPDHMTTLGNLVALLCETCDWERLPRWAERLDRLTASDDFPATALAEAPFVHMRRCEDPVRNLDLARRRAAHIAGQVASHRGEFPPLAPPGDGRDGPVRIAYLSGDFRDHPVGHLMAGVIERHDRARVRVTCYSSGADDGSDVRRRIAAACDGFVDVQDESHVAAAHRIRDDGIQLLVDLNGHTADARLAVAALRPAPVQATYMGYPGTIGGDFIDYIIADATVAPFADAGCFAEKIVQLPHCLLPCTVPQGFTGTPPARAALGLPDRGVVFGAFNDTTKFEPVMFGLWMELLRSVEDSVLWLRVPSDIARENLLRFAGQCGVAGDRLVFADRVPGRLDFLDRLAAADLMLDTRVFNGHATTLDALLAGVPLVALEGAQFASRVAASALRAACVPELVTASLDGYRALAVALATDEARRLALRQRLREARRTAPLFDTDGFTRGLEAAYAAMWRNFLSGAAPRAFAVDAERS